LLTSVHDQTSKSYEDKEINISHDII